MKLCCTCKQLLEIRLFSIDRKRKDGLSNQCRICIKKRKIHLRGRHKGMAETITTKEIWNVFRNFKGQCFKCGTQEQLTIDHNEHDKPLCSHNAVVLCNQCNAKKRRLSPNVFYSNQELMNLKHILFQSNTF